MTQETRVLSGQLPAGCPDFIYLPLEVPPDTREIHVAYVFDHPKVPAGTQGNGCDIGMFDERGTDLHSPGFRGWSGGARTEFFIRADEATPGYLPGPLNPGTWHIILGPYMVAATGLNYTVTATLTTGRAGPSAQPVYPPERAKGRGRAWYRGDCHLHSVYSDGKRTPEQIAALARAAKLDFINTSEHNTTSSHAHWSSLAGDDLLILLGEELTTRNGHCLAIGTAPGTFADWRYRARDGAFADAADVIHAAQGLVVPAHPYATCFACGWKLGYDHADALEVWNGTYTPDDELALASWDATLAASAASGRWLPAMGNSDAHKDPDVVGLPQTVVLADDLTREAILAGLAAGHSYLAESSAIRLTLTATSGDTTAGIGERLEVPLDAPVTVRLQVSGAPGCTPRFVTDEGVPTTGPALPASGAGTLEWRTTASYAQYVRAEVRHPPGAAGTAGAWAAITNPVWLGASS
ncbi:CehA/McbA family metallohydrolase [Streptomyces sp. NPDC050095]|uniref:CehA/McbA family metallohydrolase n=1 Tax=unclassified Streptomyces TaxID=2593676 RepID=UPI003448B09B